MSATDELRRMLDERGVKYKSHYLNTSWHAGTKLYMAIDNMDGTLTVDSLTPEQVITATATPSWDGWRITNPRCRKCAYFTLVSGIPGCYCASRTVKHGAQGDECVSYREVGE